MSSYRYRPSKPVAITGAVLGAALLVVGLVRMLDGGAARDGGGLAFLVLWVAVGLAVIGMNLWAAFATNGSLAMFSRVPDDEDGRSADQSCWVRLMTLPSGSLMWATR